MTDQHIERVENLIRVVSAVRDEDFSLWRWCDCAVGHALKDDYFIEHGFDPAFIHGGVAGKSYMKDIGEFFDISPARAVELFVPSLDRGYGSRKQVLAALRVLLLEKMAQQIDIGIYPDSAPLPRIEELADAAA